MLMNLDLVYQTSCLTTLNADCLSVPSMFMNLIQISVLLPFHFLGRGHVKALYFKVN